MTWKNICNMYFSINEGSLKSYLQWFPFTKLTNEDKAIVSGENFYNEYIKTASFFLFSHTSKCSENFLQKSDGSFRDSSLVTPILYLLLQAVGKKIFDRYTSLRPLNISVYYAGNYEFMRPKYKQDYDNFFKELNSYIDEYQYFIKTDITNFYSNINVDKLIAQIDRICNVDTTVFSQTQLYLFKELLIYCGNGRFPLIENSIASSFLATMVYLDLVDTKLHEYISKNIEVFSSFRIVRYVDDMYILISSEKNIECLHDAYNEIRNEYSSILKEFDLALNTKKCCLKETGEINQELKKSLYDEYFNGQKHDIEEMFVGALKNFVDDLYVELVFDSIDVEKYNEIIKRHFSSDDIEFTSNEVFNYFVYENERELKSEPVVNSIVSLVEQSISFISLDPKRLTVMIMKTHNDKAIKKFLNQLFIKNREGKWNSYDTTIAISYLIQSGFRHIDLLKIIEKQHQELYEFYLYNCKSKFIDCFNRTETNELRIVIDKDNKAYYLFFMYLCELKRENYMAAFAYYKNYFDRVTADLDFAFNQNNKLKKPNYKGFYKEKSIAEFYKSIEGSKIIIENAHDLRNANPVSHSSSELIDHSNTSKELKESIEKLSGLINKYIEQERDNSSTLGFK